MMRGDTMRGINPAGLAGAVLLVGLFVFGQWLDLGPDDAQAEHDQARAQELLQQTEATGKRIERAARKACADRYGPNTDHHWDGGQLVCDTRRASFVASSGERL